MGDDTALEDALCARNFCEISAAEMGPAIWKTIHDVTRVHDPTPERQEALRQFISSLALLLPCSKCSEHFQVLAEGVQTDTRLAALKWGIDAHNAVNARLGKPVLSYKEAVRHIANQEAAEGVPSTSSNTTGLVVAVCVLAGVVVILFAVLLARALRKKTNTHS